ncbi:hypothetical protein [Pyrococcus kukulkanii]|uniref:hypothetical protein n=1 Tax=Pyrococcus kukulkanii TaxID=1609559 RepID=UPI003567B558
MVEKVVYIGGVWKDGELVVADSETTRKQIEEVKKYECAVKYEGKPLTWDDFEDIFNAIIEDRRLRVDEGKLMATRPQYAEAYMEDGKVVRFIYYAGRDELRPMYDLKAE